MTIERKGTDDVAKVFDFSGLPGWLIWLAGHDYISGN